MPLDQFASVQGTAQNRRRARGVAIRTRMPLIAISIAFLVAIPVGVSLPAQAGETPAPPEKTIGTSAGSQSVSPALIKTQEDLHKLVDRIISADKLRVSKDPSVGLSSVVLDPDRGLLNLYWHGPRSVAVNKEIASSRSHNLQVRVHDAPYTLSQLSAERDRLADRYIKHAKSGDPKMTSIGAKPDGSGLEIGIDTAATSLKLAQSTITSTVAVDLVAGDSPIKASRYLDANPYWGGSYMERRDAAGQPVEGACTMGFSTSRGQNPYNMLTANHCGTAGGSDTWTLSNGATYGYDQPTTTGGQDYDAMLINVSESRGVIYDGPSIATGDTNNGKYVVGHAQTLVGDRLCTSGSFSGTVCNIRAMAVGQTINVGGYGQIKQTVRADQQDNIAAVGNGDSGGPVFALTDPGLSRTIARGTISAIPGSASDWRTCQGVPGVPNNQTGRHCSFRFWFPDIRYQLGAYPGVSLLTAP